MKQTSDKSEQAIRQLSDKLSEIITEAHTHMIIKGSSYDELPDKLNNLIINT